MRDFLDLMRFSASWAVAPLILFFALLMAGSDTHAHSALLAGALTACTALAIALTPSPALRDAFAAHGLASLCAGAFLMWTALTVWPLPSQASALAHPWSHFFLWDTPGISLAPTATLLALVFMLAPFCAFYLGAVAASDRSIRTLSAQTLSALTIVTALLALSDFAADPNKRLDAGLSSANVAAVLFGALGVAALALALRAARRAEPSQLLPKPLRSLQILVSAPLSSGAAFLAFTCVMLTASRGGVIVVGAGLLVFIGALALKQGRSQAGGFSLARLVLGLALPIAAVAVASADTLFARFGEGSAAIVGREQLLAAHWTMALERPLLGHGAGAYDQLNFMAMTLDNMGPLRQAGAAHNIFVQTLEESGLIGLGFLGAAIGLCLVRTIVKTMTSGRSREWNAAALAISAVLLGHGAFDFALQVPAVATLYAFLLGLFTPKPWD